MGNTHLSGLVLGSDPDAAALASSATEIDRVCDVSARVVTVTANTTLTESSHSDKVILFNDADGATLTLPAATGSGCRITCIVGVTVTSNSDKIQVADATDTIDGTIVASADGGDTVVGWEAAADSDTISLNGTTTGGIIGDWIELIDVKSNQWVVRGQIQATGTEATPFSAAVS